MTPTTAPEMGVTAGLSTFTRLTYGSASHISSTSKPMLMAPTSMAEAIVRPSVCRRTKYSTTASNSTAQIDGEMPDTAASVVETPMQNASNAPMQSATKSAEIIPSNTRVSPGEP